jgi:hypothetical protein
MFISFGWTSEPFLANAKTVTRRYWKTSHALKFRKGMFVDAYDKLPYSGGKKIGTIRLEKDPFLQRTFWMTEKDYRDEGFLWMEQNYRSIQGKQPRAFFEDWKKQNDYVWVIRFVRVE